MALRSAAGFSLIELLIVIAMLLCLIAISLPSVMHSVAALRCRLTMTGLSGVVQQSRSYAIKNNKNMSVHFATSGGQTIAYLEDPSLPPALASAVESKEIALGQGVKLVAKPTGTNAPPELTGTFMWGEDETPSTGDMSFNSRGLPCYWNTTTLKCDAGTDASGNEGYVYYFTYQPPVGENGWSALSVSPAGRIKIWTASGNTWMTN
jgi:prepilin-type N-terminal cleavage/methylation domain-containing protein